MRRRPEDPGGRPGMPAPNGRPGPDRLAASPAAAPAADDDRLAALQASLAARWAVILKRFRDYMHRT